MSKKHKEHKEDKSQFVPQRDKIKDSLQINEFPWTEKQKQLIDLILNKDTKMVFISGPAGTSKTLISAYCGLKLLNDKKVSDILYIRTIIESASKSMGALPGFADEKFQPFLMPLEDKLHELVQPAQVNKLLDDKRIQAMPINFVRGASWNARYIWAEEQQNATFGEITTLITRLGKFSKMIIVGDPNQSDLNGKSGFRTMFNIFNDEESRKNGIFTFEFTKEDIMRSGTVKFIVEKLEQHKEIKSKEPMFS